MRRRTKSICSSANGKQNREKSRDGARAHHVENRIPIGDISAATVYEDPVRLFFKAYSKRLQALQQRTRVFAVCAATQKYVPVGRGGEYQGAIDYAL